ncbi:MAG: polysaccharide biosynthesis tyrosine autokinase [Muribaculaceae bacterium]|nr:polysaccharide biosynthesis tyrosine autokinase [Muribaculaceae bacterium]
MTENAENKDIQIRNKRNASAGTVPLTDIIYMTLHYWPWILLSVFICVGVTYFRLLRTPDIYSRSAEVMIKDGTKGQTTGAEAFSKMGLMQSKANIQNEIYNFKSKDLMEEVVTRLGLDVNYYHRGRFHNEVAYGYGLPVKLTVADFPENDSFSLDLAVSKDGKVTISDLHSSGREFKQTFTGKLNDSIVTPIGKMCVTPTSAFHNGTISLQVKKVPLSSAIGSYNGRLSATTPNEEASVIRLTLSDQSPQRADDVLNTLIGVYNENWIRDKNQIAVSTSNFINDRLGIIERELGHVDSDISSYKSSILLPDVGAAASMYMGESQQTQARIFEVTNQLAIARYIRSYIAAEGNHDQLLPANTGLTGGNVQSLISSYNEDLLQRNALVAKSSEKNQLVVQLDEQLAAQRKAIIGTIDNEISVLDTQLRALNSREAQTMSRIASNPNQAKNLLSTERQQKVKESLYLYLLQKREETELSQAFTAYNTRVVNRPGASGVPTTPDRRKILLTALLIGLIIPFAVIYIKEMINTKVRGRKDVEHLIVPFLGEIPQYKSSKKKQKQQPDDEKRLLVKPGKRDIINEAFRVLRTNVEFMSQSFEGGKIISLTSFNPGSGKSFISMNLGMSIALKNKRVLVVDGDMRHGSTSAYIGSPELGLSDYLSGAVNDINSLLVQSQNCETLYVLPIGSTPPNPTELLESPRLETMLNTLKQEFDYIIIDCPPIEVVADAQIIDRYSDRTFFIVRAGLLERSMLPELDRLYEEKKYSNMGFILNGTRNDQGRYGYSYSYRYGYGYGYGYGYNYGDDGKKRKHRSSRKK